MDMVVLIDSPGFRVLNRSRLLKNAEVPAVTEVTDLLHRAYERDKLMLQQTMTAYEQARQDGWQQGIDEAKALMSARLAAAVVAKQLALVDLSPILVNIVSSAMSLLLKNADPARLLTSSMEAVGGLLKKAQWAKLRVHPSHAEMARRTLGQSSANLGSLTSIAVVADATLAPEDCIFETDVGIADASLSVQLQAINTALEAAIASLVHKAGSVQALAAAEELPLGMTTD